MKITKYILSVLAPIIFVTGIVYAGSLVSPGEISSQSYTLQDIYDKLANDSAPSVHSLSTTTAPSGTLHTLNEIYNAVPATLSMSDTSEIIPVGINRAETALSAIDSDFVASQIATGTIIFGITGTYTGSGNSSLSWQQIATTTTLSWSHGAYEISHFGSFVTLNSVTMGASEYCQYLNVDGITLASTEQNLWRLPTKGELTEASNDPDVMAGFPDGIYWSSTENSAASAYAVEFPLVSFRTPDKAFPEHVRCVK